jgi:hypothetical protein
MNLPLCQIFSVFSIAMQTPSVQKFAEAAGDSTTRRRKLFQKGIITWKRACPTNRGSQPGFISGHRFSDAASSEINRSFRGWAAKSARFDETESNPTGTADGQRIAMMLLATNPPSPATIIRMAMRSAL